MIRFRAFQSELLLVVVAAVAACASKPASQAAGGTGGINANGARREPSRQTPVPGMAAFPDRPARVVIQRERVGAVVVVLK